MKFEFNLQMFWMLGLICFIIIGLGNLYTMAVFWEGLHLGSKFSKTAGVAFNFILAYFFLWMLKGSRKSEELKSDKEILKVFKEGEKKFSK